ncbi:MAG: hypothetical protein QOJ30_2690 [Pseudonocardiales bacterium]|jgi:hypothetical protein|nr:hypothetical protein [Pseudonocardiales bacterium]
MSDHGRSDRFRTQAGALGFPVMAFRWRYLDASGAETAPPADAPEEFDDQAEAEAWFGDTWEDLREAGIDAVDLLDDSGEKVYGPMSLQEG